MAKMMKVNGNLKVTSSVIAEGDLVIKGSTKSVDAENLLIKDNLVVVAKDNTTALVTPAGLLAKNYDGENDGALVFDADGVAYVGDVTLYEDGTINSEVSDLQPLATRELEPLDKGFAKWDATTNKFITDKDVASLTKLNKAAHSLVLSGTSLLLKDANDSDAALSTITQTELRTAIATGVNANESSFIFPKYSSTGLITGAVATAKQKAMTLNGTSLGSLYGTSDTGLTLYAPSSSGNNNQVLISKGANNAPVWVNQSDLAAGKATNDSDGNAINNTYLKRSGGTITGSINLASDIRIQDSEGNNLLVNYIGSHYTYINGTGNVLYLQGKNARPSYGSADGNTYDLATTVDLDNKTFIKSSGILAPQQGRTQALGDVYSYNVSNLYDETAPKPYMSVIGFGQGALGTIEVGGCWTTERSLWYRGLRDWNDDWNSWKRILTEEGGTMSGPLVLAGGDAVEGVGNIQLSDDGQITAKGTNATLFGRTNSGADLYIGHNSYNTILRGKQARPTYNSTNIALASDLGTQCTFSLSGTTLTITPK